MNVLMVRAKIKEENVADARAAIEKVIQALEQVQPAGVRYTSCLLSDGVTFVALLELEDDGGHPLRGFPAYQEMAPIVRKLQQGDEGNAVAEQARGVSHAHGLRLLERLEDLLDGGPRVGDVFFLDLGPHHQHVH